ncbi:MAG: hypothetical protein FJX74_20380 [Armatimonadetes bacterium]|nr:hypothetical protein [Armatimonadota bacterium]
MAVACLACVVLCAVGSVLAQETGVEELSPAEMEGIEGSQTGESCDYAPAMRTEGQGYPWSHVCPPGEDSKCMADGDALEGDWCIRKVARLGYHQCTSQGASWWQQCWQCRFHCYRVLKYPPGMGGSCNNGDPEQQCQGQPQGFAEVGSYVYAWGMSGGTGWVSM